MGAPLNEKFETDPEREENSREIQLRQGWLMVQLRDLGPRAALSVAKKETVAEAIELMNREKIGAVLVVENNRLVGIFTERDVLTKIAGRRLDFSKIHVGDYMTPDPETLSIESKVAFALNMMAVGGFRHVPLVEADGRPVGMISVRDIIEHIAELFPKDVLNLPIDPDHELRNLYGG